MCVCPSPGESAWSGWWWLQDFCFGTNQRMDSGKRLTFSLLSTIIRLFLVISWHFEHSFQTVPLQFLNALLSFLGDSVRYDTTPSGLTSPLACCPSPSFSKVVTPSQGIVRWKLRLEYFAYETLQDLRIAKLFEIIVDYPERYTTFFLPPPTYLTWRLKHCISWLMQQFSCNWRLKTVSWIHWTAF